MTPDRTPGSSRERSLADQIIEQLEAHYVFPEKVPAMASALRAADYTGLAGKELCERVTEDLRAACPDLHLRVVWTDEPRKTDGQGWDEAAYWAESRERNHGIPKVELLDGNIGYIKVDSVDEAEETAATVTAAMALMAHTKALILDVRANTGGAPSGVAYWCSFFFGTTPVHLNDVFDRDLNSTQQYWTLPHLPGARYLDRPVYVLTSNRTFSGGEELAYNLQAMKRATIVGQATRGGAHPVDIYPVSPNVHVRIPMARSINPITGTNWEGVGVQPDIAAEDALAEALRHAVGVLGDDSTPDN